MDDYISRQAAIDALGERPMVWTSDDNYSLGERNQYDIDRLAIETVPSADVQPVIHARWEIGTGFRWRCSKCGGLTYIPSKFCFNCGARMDGET